MTRKNNRQQNIRFSYRINERIHAPSLRVLNAVGEQVGIMTREEALSLAQDQELDLVEIAAQAKPPVAKVIDFNKFLYQESKKKQEEKKKAKVSETKELRLGPFMSSNDLQVVVRRGRGFLQDGDKVKLVLKFRGRQITHPEFGHAIIGRTIEALSDISKVDREARLEGKQLIAVISPERKKNAEKENKEISS
ncbi:MAG: translation initiation factor [Patescibacteria group bacterium]|nr:translation initiation factor [Patescibacteria group bacterium]